MSENTTRNTRLGFWGLTGIVFGSVIGGSIFNLAQTLARSASLGAMTVAWLIAGAGILFLVLTLKRLADVRPDLRAGIYEYAGKGFGRYMGFNMAWGYWLCVILGNVAYAVMLTDAVGSFWPAVNSSGTSLFISGTVLVWLMFALVSRGVQSAAFVNTLLSGVKFLCIVLIIAVLGICIKVGLFTADFWGRADFASLGSFGDQLSACMLVTVWSFMGIEGAVMMSARARRQKDVGRATVTGFLLALILYMLVSALCFGVMTRPEMAHLPNPSLAYVLDACAGSWAKWFVIASVIVSIAGGFVAWTLVCAQVPYEAAAVGIFPKRFMRLNGRGMPWYGMLVASVVMTACLLLVVTAEDAYLATLNLTALMILPPYLFCGLYLWKISRGSVVYRAIAAAEVVFCLYIMWSGGLELLMVTSIFYLAGTGVYVAARIRESVHPHHPMRDVFTRRELIVFLLILICAVVSILRLAAGTLRL